MNYLFFLPDLFRLYVRLMLDHRVGDAIKLQLFAAVVYLISPLDLLPEGFLGPVGYVDDVFILSSSLLRFTKTHALAEGLLVEHWSGDASNLNKLIEVSQLFLQNLDFFDRVFEWFVEHRTSPATA